MAVRCRLTSPSIEQRLHEFATVAARERWKFASLRRNWFYGFGFDMRLSVRLTRNRFLRFVGVSVFAVGMLFTLPLHADPVAVTCTILPGEESASVMLINPFDYRASCMANCKFSTAVYDDNPQIICSKPVAAKQQIEMCRLKAAGNKLLKVIEGIGDCRKP